MKLRKLASNAAYLAMDSVSVTILSSFFWIISGKLLSSADLGVVSTALNFASIIQFFSTLGMGVALSKLISEYSGSGKESKISKIITPAMKLLLVSNISLTILIFIFAQNLSLVIKLTPQIILVTAIIAVLLSFSNVAGYIIIGFQNMRRLMLTNLFYHLAKVAMSAIFVLLGFNFFGPLFGIMLGLLFLITLRLDIFKNLKFNLKSQGNYQDIFRYSIPALVGGIASLAFSNVPYITLTIIKDLSITGIFTPAMLLATPLFILPTSFTIALFPIISGLSAGIRNSNEKAFLLKIVFRYTILLTLPLAMVLIIFSDQIVLFLFKPEYLPAVELLKILSVGALLQGLSGIFLGTIYALKRPKVQQNILISNSLFFILLSLPLTYYLSATGMAIAYTIATFTLFILSYIYVKKMVTVNIPYLDIMKISIATILIIGFITFFKPMLPTLISILLILPSIVIYFVSLLYLNFYTQLDLRLIEFLSAHTHKNFGMPLKLISYLIKRKIKTIS